VEIPHQTGRAGRRRPILIWIWPEAIDASG
jgi:hypothetical protein